MHVTILQLTERPEKKHYHQDTVFENNESYFPDGVEEHTGDERADDMREVARWFGNAAEVGKDNDGNEYIEIRTDRVGQLFTKYYEGFSKCVAEMAGCSGVDFSTGRRIEDILTRMNEAYYFDWLYVINEYGDATKISEWLRFEMRHGEGKTARYYIGATYDGDQ